MPLVKFNGNLDRKKAAHLLRRATFGPNKQQIDSFTGLGIDAAIGQLFQLTPDPLPPVDSEGGTSWITPFSEDRSRENERQEFIKDWWMGLMAGQGAPAGQELAQACREKVTFFLHTFFTTIQETVSDSRSLYYQNALLRKFAFDSNLDPSLNFKALTKKICVDNAMLKVLDGTLNVKGNPNENFAREFLELYTIGKGLELKNRQTPAPEDPGDYRHFTEQDVQAAARVLSGFKVDLEFTVIDPDTGLPRGQVRGEATNANQHDNDPKEFSFRFGNQVISPDAALVNGDQATEESALQEIDDLVEMVFAQEETSRHICRRVYRFYIYHDITVELDNDIISDMVNIFQSNGYRLEPLVRALLSSQHFFDSVDANPDNDRFGSIIKSPLDLIISTIRFYGVNMPNMFTDPANYYGISYQLREQMEEQGMRFLNPFDIAGYEAYYQYPLFNRYWISTNALTKRYRFIDDIMNGIEMPEGEGMMLRLDVVDYVRNNIPNNIAENARELVKEMASLLLPLSDKATLSFDMNNDDNSELTAERLTYFLDFFLTDQDPDPEGFWTARWNGNLDPETTQRQLENLFKALMQSPEYQLF